MLKPRFALALTLFALCTLVLAPLTWTAPAPQRQIAERQVPVCHPAIESYISYNGAVGRWVCSDTPPAGDFSTITLGGTAIARTAAQVNLLAQGVASGYKVARGETALDGSNPTDAATGLATIVACTASIKSTSAPGVGTSTLTYTTSGATLSLYGWRPTSSSDTTLVASTGTETVGWVCVGT
jgi:hypothetical protein